jgi:hypothetical protein
MPPRRTVSFNEKVHWRLRHDRRPLLAGTCDKLAMKDHARSLAGGLVRIPTTFWSGTDLTDLADVELPDRWVLKPNDASGLVLFGHGPAHPEELAARTQRWTDRRRRRQYEEWAYRLARPLLLVEELIGAPDEALADLKVLVFDGVPRVVAVHTGRRTLHRNRLYTPDWQPLPWTGGYPPGPDVRRPERLADMLEAASLLAAGFDMLRVDFYEHDGVLWFGELTPYPGAGTRRIERELDVLQGSWWTLPRADPRRFGSPTGGRGRTRRDAVPRRGGEPGRLSVPSPAAAGAGPGSHRAEPLVIGSRDGDVNP